MMFRMKVRGVIPVDKLLLASVILLKPLFTLNPALNLSWKALQSNL